MGELRLIMMCLLVENTIIKWWTYLFWPELPWSLLLVLSFCTCRKGWGSFLIFCLRRRLLLLVIIFIVFLFFLFIHVFTITLATLIVIFRHTIFLLIVIYFTIVRFYGLLLIFLFLFGRRLGKLIAWLWLWCLRCFCLGSCDGTLLIHRFAVCCL